MRKILPKEGRANTYKVIDSVDDEEIGTYMIDGQFWGSLKSKIPPRDARLFQFEPESSPFG